MWQQRQEQQAQYLQQHIATAMEAAGHRCSLQPNSLRSYRTFYERVRVDFDQMAEWLVADALQLGPMECIVNSGSIMQLAPQLSSRKSTAGSSSRKTARSSRRKKTAGSSP